jgi:amino acid transporter
VTKAIHPALGYLTGWAMVMDYILNPVVCTIICSKLTQNVLPGVPYWLLAIAFAALFTGLNLRAIQSSARINGALAAAMLAVVAIFFAVVIRWVWLYHEIGATFWTRPFYDPQTFSLHAVLRGTSIAVLTYIGFDGISTFSEETKNPRRNILLATVLVCAVTGVLSSLEVYAAQLIWGSRPFPTQMVESAFPVVAQRIGGLLLFHLLNFTILIANFGSGMGAQLVAGRLLYGMGRNAAIPRRFFGSIEPKRRIPANSIVFVGVLALAGALLVTYERSVELLNFGAFIAFIGVNAAAFTHYFLRARERTLINFAAPILGLAICFFVWLNLSTPAKIAGGIWMLVGWIYGACRTKGFRARELSFDAPAAAE